MKKGPKKQHFVPKSYLKAFLDSSVPTDQEPYLWQISKVDRVAKKKAPTNILKLTHLYTLEKPGLENPYVVEEFLGKIEQKYYNIYSKKIKLQKSLTDEEHAELCLFIFIMFYRNPAVKESMFSFISEIEERIKSLEKQHGASPHKSLLMSDHKKNAHAETMVELSNEISSLIMKMKLTFLIAPEVGSRFITSDRPCFFLNPSIHMSNGSIHSSPGLGQKDVELYLPLSPKITVLLTWSNLQGYVKIKNSQVEEINRMIVFHANDYLISNLPKIKMLWFRRFPLSIKYIIGYIIKKARAAIKLGDQY